MTRLRPFARRAVAPAAALVFALVINFPSAAQQQPAEPQPVPPGAVRVTLLQVNDVYQIAPVDRGARGGLARLAALRRKIAQDSPHTLLLLGGDTIAPSVASNIFKGRQMIETWNAAALDLAVLGNHEFDFGPEVLRERIKESRFVWLGANVIDRATGRPFGDTQPFVVRDFGGVKVGFFGVLMPGTRETSKPGEGVEFRDPCATAKELVPKIRAAGARAVVALTHQTMEEDKAFARCVNADPKLNAKVDLIVGGHEHTLLQSSSAGTPIFKMTSDAREVGRLDLNISKATGEVESIDWQIIALTSQGETAEEDKAVAAVVGEYEKKLSAELDKPVGVTTVELDARQATNRSRETNLGNFITDSYRAWAKSDIAIINSGSVRSNTTYGPGTLTKRDALSVLPFENHVVKIEATGAQIRAALEHGVGRVAESAEEGRFPQVSGLTFTYDARRPAGSRVVEVKVGGQPLDDRKTYTVASNAYLVGGGDGYTMFRGARFLLNPEEGPVEAAVIMDAILAAKEIAPRTDGRIKRLDGN
ncbi:MAG TPA: 5'-nucleotidase C-terminal domain-containing protein [Pyrinomonadaceae bacterium]|nr:5'-nucleotidase C-terminal domain-containing protein [Pyrinomonadaceae bacterium]